MMGAYQQPQQCDPVMLSILIAEDHEIVRRGIRQLISTHPGWDVCAEAGDGQTAYDLALTFEPNVAILDIGLPGMDGLELTRRLHQALPSCAVLIFTMYDDQETLCAALEAGVHGYALKSEGPEQLEAAISALGARRHFFSPAITEFLMDVALHNRDKSPRTTFTQRELEVAQLIADGNGNKAIAEALGICIKTVESHRATVLRKAGVHTAAEFVRFAVKNKFIRA
jgi:DNA-binding NarL/FixJ family response regulator